jgi:CBS domain-containing protein
MEKRYIAFIIKNREPLLLQQKDTVSRACQLMHEKGVGAVLVVDEKQKLTGIFTGRDAVRMLAEGHHAPAMTMVEAMTPHPCTITPDQTSMDALREMNDRGFRHLPVVDNGVIVGIVSRGDFKGAELERLGDETSLWERIC